MKLFPFQEKEVEVILKGFKSSQIQCLAWYTGAGKTNVFVEVCARLIKRDPKVQIGISAYLTKEIRDQVTERFQEFGLGDKVHTVVTRAIKHNPSKNITVFNPQCLFHAVPKELQFDYFFIDESHVGTDESCKMIRGIINKTCIGEARFLLISATPWDTLAMKRFKDAVVYKRPLDKGLSDGLISDTKFHAEEAQITFEAKDFSRLGDLTRNASTQNMAVLKSACVGKMEHLIKKYDRELGKKVLVICPPGNYGEIAQEMAERFGGLPFIMGQGNRRGERAFRWVETEDNLEKFKSDPKVRFLFVINKCQVGFDFKDLSSVVDLTMSRNIKLLAQRFGRVARKSNINKHYFYVYDKSLLKDRLEWLLCTMIDFCLGHYDGWTSKTAKFRPVSVNKNFGHTYPISVTLREIVSALRETNINNMKTLKFVTYSSPVKWTLEKATAEAKRFSSRTDMWSRRPALYKWFRINAKAEMDKIFPIKTKKWTEASVINVMKKCSTRQEFKDKYAGADAWLRENGLREKLGEKYLPKSRSTKRWDKKSVRETLKNIRSWSKLRTEYNGLRRWMHENGTEKYWRQEWMQLRGGEK